VKPGGGRLTDAEWQAIQANQDSRPDRPEWVNNFVAIDRGADWQARVCLRTAEQLFLAGKPDDAIAGLRQAILTNPDSPISTECQLRIGRYYLDHNDTTKAIAELSKCHYLPGCDAYDEAQYIITSVQENGAIGRSRPLTETQKSDQAKYAELVVKLNGSTPAARQQMEDKLVNVAADLQSQSRGDDDGIIEKALAVCKTPQCRDVLTYIEASTREFSAERRDPANIYAAASGVASAPVRAAIIAQALEQGYLADNPAKVMALLNPLMRQQPFPADGASRKIASLSQNSEIMGLYPPSEEFTNSLSFIREQLVTTAYSAGNYALALQYCKEIPASDSMHNDADEIETKLKGISATDYPTLLQFNTIAEESEESAQTAHDDYQFAAKYPKFKYASVALLRAESIYRELGRDSDADQIIAKIKVQVPGSYVPIFRQAQKAAANGDFATARILCRQINALDQKAEAARRTEDITSLSVNEYDFSATEGAQNLLTKINLESSLRRAIKLYVAASQWPAFTHRMLVDVPPTKLADEVIRMNPKNAPAVYSAILNVESGQDFEEITRGSSVSAPSLRLVFLKNCPDSSQLQPVLQDDRLNYWLYGASVQDIAWLAALVNRGPSYRYAAQVATIFGGSIIPKSSYAEVQLAAIQKQWPLSRAAVVAANAAVKILLSVQRPETAQAILNEPICPLVSVDPALKERTSLIDQVSDVLTAKHRKPWEPIWSVQLPVVTDFDASLE